MNKEDEIYLLTSALEDASYRHYFAEQFYQMRNLVNAIPDTIAREIEEATKYTIARLERQKDQTDERE